jgi:exosortase/archaeosortase family protein
MDARAARHASTVRRAVLGFLVRCLAYWAAALALVSRVPAVDAFGIRLTLATLQAAFGLLHIAVRRVEDVVYVGPTSVQIVSDCSPHTPYLIYAAVVLAFPATWKRRLVGLLAGAVVIHVFNTIRILALIGILIWKSAWFDFAHVYLWQTGTVLVVFTTFALWLRSTRPRAIAPPSPHPA